MIRIDELKKFKDMIDSANTVGIASHINPDGDNLGSSIGLALALKQYNKDVEIIGHSSVPEYLSFMENISMYNDKNKYENYDLFIVLDCSEIDRIDKAYKYFDSSLNTIVVDHHVKGGIVSDLNIIYEDSSSTCELIYELVEYLGIDFNKDISTAIFTGIVTDTGRFMYENVKKSTLLKAAELIENGADSQYIYQNLYQNKEYDQILMESNAISNLQFFDDKKKAFFYISKEFVSKYNKTIQDTDSIVNIIRDIKGIKLSCILKETDEKNKYKVSLRSKSDEYDVSEIARTYGGGGHKKASGFEIISETNHEAVEKIKEIIKAI